MIEGKSIGELLCDVVEEEYHEERSLATVEKNDGTKAIDQQSSISDSDNRTSLKDLIGENPTFYIETLD
jgi:hypothetical protein